MHSLSKTRSISNVRIPYALRLRISTLASAFLLLTTAAHAELVTNGGFENPDVPVGQTVTSPDSTTIPGWTVSTGEVDLVDAAGNGFLVGAAAEGGQYLDLIGFGTNHGTISQALSTTVGGNYLLSFQYADNYGSGPATKEATVRLFDTIGNILGPTTVSHSTSANGNLDWSLFQMQFTAREALTTVEFVSTVGGANAGLLLDAVSVTSVPEPSALLLCGLFTLGGAVYRRRSPRA